MRGQKLKKSWKRTGRCKRRLWEYRYHPYVRSSIQSRKDFFNGAAVAKDAAFIQDDHFRRSGNFTKSGCCLRAILRDGPQNFVMLKRRGDFWELLKSRRVYGQKGHAPIVGPPSSKRLKRAHSEDGISQGVEKNATTKTSRYDL